MFDLQTIKVINDKLAARQLAKQKAETETTRQSSYTEHGGNVILHSAKQRATVFLKGEQAAHFLKRMRQVPALAKLRGETEEGCRNWIIERYF